MELTIENLKKVPTGNRFALFLNGTLAGVFVMLAGHRYVQVTFGLSSWTLSKFIENCNEEMVVPTIEHVSNIKIKS
ncbi:MAG: hypothetical protein JWO03_919 [Bacteroidetes bacterium]|nr:hypothetical protein [Bacteroidota bacterium]